MQATAFKVAHRAVNDAFDLLRDQFANHFRRNAESKYAAGNLLALADERTRAENGIMPDFSVREDNRLHTNQHAITHRRAVYYRAMPNRTILSDSKRRIGIHVQHAIILDIGAPSNHNRGRIPANDGVVPDACPLVNRHIANNHGSWRNKYVGGNFRHHALKWQNWHGFTPRK